MKRKRFGIQLMLLSVLILAFYGLSEGAPCPLDAQQHYWRLDEAAAPYADSAGSTNVTCTNCPDSVAGKVGNAAGFNGTDDAATADGSTVNWANEDLISIELWVKTAGSCTSTQVFIGRDEPGSGTPLHWWVGCSGGLAKFRLTDTAGNGKSATSATNIADGNWHHLVGVRNADNKIRIYVDGHEDGSADQVYTGDFSGTAPINVGNLAGSYLFAGTLDEISIYKRALTPQEIAAHYNSGSGTAYCGSGPPPVENNPPIAPQIVSAVVNADGTVTFTWKPTTDPDEGDSIKEYEVYYSKNADFSGCTPIKVDASGKILAYAGFGGFGAGLLLMGLTLAGGIRKRKKVIILIGLLLVASAFLVSCGGGGGGDGTTPPPNNNLSVTTTEAVASGTWHWKVVAHDQHDASAETMGEDFVIQ
jgi:hypothetical protein